MDEQVRELLVRIRNRARTLIAAAISELRRITAPLLALWARLAIRRWERVQQVFSEHRDLVDTDRWLDRWYSFGAA
ncbi:MAG: hypothetical protein M3P91_05270 [Actinomycetota bacterium]|nr:hypothetical protein [Actinomycetota bacterium]